MRKRALGWIIISDPSAGFHIDDIMQPVDSDENIQESAIEQWLTVYLILEVFSVALWEGTVAREQKKQLSSR